jgi:hypothetical protein
MGGFLLLTLKLQCSTDLASSADRNRINLGSAELASVGSAIAQVPLLQFRYYNLPLLNIIKLFIIYYIP